MDPFLMGVWFERLSRGRGYLDQHSFTELMLMLQGAEAPSHMPLPGDAIGRTSLPASTFGSSSGIELHNTAFLAAKRAQECINDFRTVEMKINAWNASVDSSQNLRLTMTDMNSLYNSRDALARERRHVMRALEDALGQLDLQILKLVGSHAITDELVNLRRQIAAVVGNSGQRRQL